MRDLSTAIVETTSHVIRHANLLAPERGHRLSTAIRTDTGLGAGGIEMTKRPDRYRNAIVPHIYVDGASDAIAFYKRAFGAVELFRFCNSRRTSLRSPSAHPSVSRKASLPR